MKKIISTSCFIISSIFLTGCWKKKKIEKPVDQLVCTKEENSIQIESTGKNNDGEMVVEFLNEETLPTDESDNAVITIFDESETEETKNPEENESSEITTTQEPSLREEEESENLIQKKKVHLGTLLFDFNVFKDVSNKYKKHLPEIAEKIKIASTQNNNVHVIIEGHACNSDGSEKYNLWLSDERAQTIKERLSEILGEQANTLSLATFGCGTSHLIVEGNREEQAPNRRVEVYIIAH